MCDVELDRYLSLLRLYVEATDEDMVKSIKHNKIVTATTK